VRTPRRVSWCDCDPSGLIRFQAPFDWVVDAEVELLREAGVGDAFGTMPRVAASAEYRRPLVFDDAVEVEVRVSELGTSSVRYAFRVLQGEEACVTGSITAVHVADGRATPLPDAVRAALESEQIA
jgi:acyl-CoA thioester hydrolase